MTKGTNGMSAPENTTTRTGSCLCGAVRYAFSGVPDRLVACHCVQCRKTSGHYLACLTVNPDALDITADAGLAWYRSSEKAVRGFCQTCGSSLFWKANDNSILAVFAGTIDGPTGLQLCEHIYVGNRGDYYDLADGLPQKPAG